MKRLPDVRLSRTGIRAWEIAVGLAALALFIGLRWALLSPAGLARGWNSDTAIFGLSGKRMLEHHRIDIFFWGQNYMGPLTSLATAAIGWALLQMEFARNVWPLALRLAAMTETAVGCAVFWLGLRLAFGRAAAAIGLLLLAVGPSYLFLSSVIAHGAEIAFLCSSILFWLAAKSFDSRSFFRPLQTAGGCLLCGLATGLGWWMNQGVVFVVLPAAWLLLLETETYSQLRRAARPLARLLVQHEQLGWRRSSSAERWAARAVNMSLLLLFLLAALHDLGASVPVFFLFFPLAEPLALLFLLQIVLEAKWGDRQARRQAARIAWREWKMRFPRLSAFAGGALLGYSPVLLGRVFRWYPVTYRQHFPVGFDGIPSHLARMFRDDLWTWLGLDRSWPSVIFLIGSLGALLVSVWKNRKETLVFLTAEPAAATPRRLAGGVIAVSLLFYAIALRHGRAPNYLAPAVPAAYGFAAAGLVSGAGSGPSRWARLAKYIGAVAISFAFLWSLVAQAKGLTKLILAEPDPGILLGRIQSAGYGICYADYWDAYKLQFLSGEEIRFIPYKSRSRNRDESLAAELAPGEKCLLLPDGTFRRFLPSDRPKPLPLWSNRPASALDLDRSRSIEFRKPSSGERR